MPMTQGFRILLLVAGLFLGGCSGPGPEDSAPGDLAGAPGAQEGATPATALVDLDFRIIGRPLIGQPTRIELTVTADDPERPVVLEYRVLDAASIELAEGQPSRLEFGFAGGEAVARHTLTVLPRREGRHYVNVAATIRADGDELIRAISIPVSVEAGAERNDRAAADTVE